MNPIHFRLLLPILILTQQLVATEASRSSVLPEVQVSTLESHKSFFSDIQQIESLSATIDVHNSKIKALEQRTTSTPTKGEFETTADFQKKIKASETEIETEARKLEIEGAALSEKYEQLSLAVKNKESNLSDLVIPLKITMGSFDADKLTIEAFTTQPFIFGAYDNRLAVATTKCPLHAATCPIEVAKRLREASDKGELFCTVRLKKPKLKLIHGPISIPMTSGEKVSSGILTFVFSALANADPSTVRLQETKSQDANIIQIEDYASVQYLQFYNKDLKTLAQQPEQSTLHNGPPGNPSAHSADGKILDEYFKREKNNN